MGGWTLSGLDLHGVRIGGADLQMALMHRTNLRSSELSLSMGDACVGVKFSHADLREVDLSESEFGAGVEFGELPSLLGHQKDISCVAVSPDDRLVASASWDKSLRVWDRQTSAIVFQIDHPDRLSSVAFVSDTRILSGCYDTCLRLWDISEGVRLLSTFSGHTKFVSSLAHFQDTAVSGSADSTVRVWDISDTTCRWSLIGHNGPVLSVAMTARFLASGGQDKCVRLWNVASGELTSTLLGHLGTVRCLAFSPDGKLLSSGSDDKNLKFWDLMSPNYPQRTVQVNAAVGSLCWSSNSAFVASGCADGAIRFFSSTLGSDKPIHTLQGHKDAVRSVIFCHDGMVLISSSLDTHIRLWSLASVPRDSDRLSLESHHLGAVALAFSSDGSTIATSGYDTTVRLWSVSAGLCTRILEGHGGPVRKLAFSENCRYLAAQSDVDALIRVWDVTRGVLVSCQVVGVSPLAFPDESVVVLDSLSHAASTGHVASIPSRLPALFLANAAGLTLWTSGPRSLQLEGACISGVRGATAAQAALLSQRTAAS
eukprot:TRINITY_DN4891_c0_g1_i15.p1 TRINITY_DN4891_c0_g1~~TRINITY_DN4891_c0_g1_i15.p1  ORF type:complete len:541 (-),score=71.42 TRINITY_DN4891_c0_g1_i15:60-1682(-)